MIKIPRSSDYSRNADRVKGDESPCVVCGKGVKRESRTLTVHVGYGGGHLLLENEVDYTSDDYCGEHPIGRDCLKKNPDLKPYVIVEEKNPYEKLIERIAIVPPQAFYCDRDGLFNPLDHLKPKSAAELQRKVDECDDGKKLHIQLAASECPQCGGWVRPMSNEDINAIIAMFGGQTAKE